MINFIKTQDTLQFFIKGKMYSVSNKTAPDNFAKAIKLLAQGAEDALLDLLDRAQVVLKQGLQIQGNAVLFNGKELHGTMVQRMFELMDVGIDAAPIKNFIQNVMQNPSPTAEAELYDFLEVGRMPLTPDGCFLGYKVVRGTYMDKHSNTMDNSPGKVVTMPRADVNPNRNETCSDGLHLCSFEYLKSFYSVGDRIVVVKVNPKDVVSIPSDYNNTKMRVCEYTVLEDITASVDPTSEDTNILKNNAAYTRISDETAKLLEEELEHAAFTCPKCGAAEEFIKRNGTKNGKQVYFCNAHGGEFRV